MNSSRPLFVLACVGLVGAAAGAQTVRADLAYKAPVDGQPKPNFSPKGMQVPLTPLSADAALPAGSIQPAKSGVMKVGPDQAAWIPILVTAAPDHPRDLTRLFVDRNRNGSFTDDGPALSATPAQNEKTRAWWTSINKVELTIPYAESRAVEPYLVNFWIVREDSADSPNIIRYSVNSWRAGTVTVNGVDALVAVMDDNDAIFSRNDMWSIFTAGVPRAADSVLMIAEARPTTRLMFVTSEGKDIPLEFRSITADGRSIEFAVLDQPITKASDRSPDDKLREERSRPRAAVSFKWEHGLAGYTAALATAKKTGKTVLLDFEATWCGPCHTMDQWIWNDLEVAGALNSGFVGVKIDVDVVKSLVTRYKTTGYPTMILLDPNGKEIKRVVDYMSSKETLEFLKAAKK